MHYNEILDNYLFVDGINFSSGKRMEWKQIKDSKSLLDKLSLNINLKKPSELYLKNIPEKIDESLRELFKDTRVGLIYEDD